MTTTEPRSLRERAAAATPEAAKAAKAASDRDYVLDNFYPKSRGPIHFRGKIVSISGPHRGSSEYESQYREWDYMTVHLDPDTLQVFKDNPNNPNQTSYNVNLPDENKTAQPNSEIVLTVEAARKVNTGIRDYFDLEGKVVEMTSDLIQLPPRKGEQYGIRIFYYVPTFIGGDNGLQSPSNGAQTAITSDPDPEQVSKLAGWLVGQEVDAVKRLAILKATSKQQLDLPDQALQSMVHEDRFIPYAIEAGLLAIEDGKYVDPSADDLPAN